MIYLTKPEDHDSHVWGYSDSAQVDFICKNCGAWEFTEKAKRPCEKAPPDADNDLDDSGA